MIFYVITCIPVFLSTEVFTKPHNKDLLTEIAENITFSFVPTLLKPWVSFQKEKWKLSVNNNWLA